MAELKTKKNDASVEAFIDSVAHDKRREDCRTVAALMTEITGEPPSMWGSSIIGFGAYHYRYASGREGEWPLTGLSPRKQSLTLYIMAGFSRYESLLGQLGKHKTGKSCLYINKLEDVDMAVLRTLIEESVAFLRQSKP